MVTTNRAYFLAAQTGVTPLAIGAPGVAKTASIQAFGGITGRQIYTLIGSLRDPADVGGYPYPGEIQSEAEVDGKLVFMRLIPPKWASDCWNGQKWIVFIDELTTCPPAVQAALLRVIAEKVVGDLALPEDTWIVSAANPPGVAANGFELESPMANRLCHLKWKMDWESWDDGMRNGMNFPAPEYDRLPDDWRNHISGTGSLISAFRKVKPGLFEPQEDEAGNLKMDRAAMGGPWPSPRSWANAATCAAAATSVNAGANVEYDLIEGCVGYSAASEFSEWKRNLDLPDPESLIQAAIYAEEHGEDMRYKHPNRPDKVIAMLGSVSHAVLMSNTKQRWEAGLRVLEMAARSDVDIACSCTKMLTRNVPSGAKLSAEFINRVFPTLKKCGLLESK